MDIKLLVLPVLYLVKMILDDNIEKCIPCAPKSSRTRRTLTEDNFDWSLSKKRQSLTTILYYDLTFLGGVVMNFTNDKICKILSKNFLFENIALFCHLSHEHSFYRWLSEEVSSIYSLWLTNFLSPNIFYTYIY